jgi:uncharacterized repeat protein (TIGR03803 family)
LHSFDLTDGVYPEHALIEASNGNFYGTTSSGGTDDIGTTFEITPAGKPTSLHSSSAPTGFIRATKTISPSPGVASYRHAVKQLLTSAVGDLQATFCGSRGAGNRPRPPGGETGNRSPDPDCVGHCGGVDFCLSFSLGGFLSGGGEFFGLAAGAGCGAGR